MSSDNITIEIHALQSIPSNLINSDDMGQPKTAFYGGVQRARVSSQAWKRRIREHCSQNLSIKELDARTLRVPERIAEYIRESRPDLDHETVVKTAEYASRAAGISLKGDKRGEAPKDDEETSNKGKGDKKDKGPTEFKKTKSLTFISNAQAKALSDFALNALDNKESFAISKPIPAAKTLFAKNHSLSIALFGRMVADHKVLDVDAACQVAHAIGVYPLATETDYYTGMDDLSKDDETGSAMLGETDFSSSLLYRYANISPTLLMKNLGSAQAVAKSVGFFLDGFVRSMPTGKQNSFAARTLPEVVLVVVRDDASVNLVQAFETPPAVSAGGSQLASACGALVDHFESMLDAYGDEGIIKTLVMRVGENTSSMDAIGSAQGLPGIIRDVESLVQEKMGGGSDD